MCNLVVDEKIYNFVRSYSFYVKKYFHLRLCHNEYPNTLQGDK